MLLAASRTISAAALRPRLAAVRARSTVLSQPSSNASLPQTPLFLRSPAFTASVGELRDWREWARRLALSVGSSFLDADGGPVSELLCRELTWVLEDAVEDYSEVRGLVASDDKDLVLVRLRIGLEDLFGLWKDRIEKRRPFQYLVGCQHWRDMVLAVQEGVLIPRPETEMIVDLVEEAVRREGRLGEGMWADLGTGSGAIGIGVGRVLGGRERVFATDVSSFALSVARFNVERYGLQDKIEIRQGSWFEPLEDVMGKLSGIVSNPPYIPRCKIPGLQAEVGRHEPILALDGGENGMDDLLHLCRGLAAALEPGGYFAFETNGESQSNFIADMLTSRMAGNFEDIKIVNDIGGIGRFITGFHC